MEYAEKCWNILVGTSLALHPKNNIHGGEFGQFPSTWNQNLVMFWTGQNFISKQKFFKQKVPIKT